MFGSQDRWISTDCLQAQEEGWEPTRVSEFLSFSLNRKGLMHKIHCWVQLRAQVSECLRWPTNVHPPPSHLLSNISSHQILWDWGSFVLLQGLWQQSSSLPRGLMQVLQMKSLPAPQGEPPPGQQGLPQLEVTVCHQHHARIISRQSSLILSSVLQSSLNPPLPSRNTFYSYSSLMQCLPLVQGLAGALTGCFSKGDHLFEFLAQKVLSFIAGSGIFNAT